MSFELIHATKPFKVLKCNCQSEEETSSGGDQLVSNKIDAITIEIGADNFSALIYFYRVAIWLKKTHLSLDKYTYHLMKLILCSGLSPRCKSR